MIQHLDFDFGLSKYNPLLLVELKFGFLLGSKFEVIW